MVMVFRPKLDDPAGTAVHVKVGDTSDEEFWREQAASQDAWYQALRSVMWANELATLIVGDYPLRSSVTAKLKERYGWREVRRTIEIDVPDEPEEDDA